MIKFVLGLFFSLGCVLGAGEPDVIYLTWIRDPTTTMTVVWHGTGGDVWFHPEGETKWVSAGAESHPIPGTKVTVHVSQLERLESNTIYIFKIEGSQKVYRFRTLPRSLSREVRFVVGGDISRSLGLVSITLSRYLRLLETLYFIELLPAWYSNLGKRLIKSPKLHFSDD